MPQYKSLSLEKILEFIADIPNIETFLPDDIDIAKTPKQWIVNVCAAVINQPFKDWVGEQVEDRNQHMAEKRDMMISMDPVMAEKFQNSTHISRKYSTTTQPDSPLFGSSEQRNLREHVKDFQQEASYPCRDQG